MNINLLHTTFGQECTTVRGDAKEAPPAHVRRDRLVFLNNGTYALQKFPPSV